MGWEDGHWFYLTPAALDIARTSSALLSFARRFLFISLPGGELVDLDEEEGHEDDT